jgi:chaperonin cofactor prefoldin
MAPAEKLEDRITELEKRVANLESQMRKVTKKSAYK